MISRVTFTGLNAVTYVRVGAKLEIRAILPADRLGATGTTLDPGTPVSLAWDPADLLIVDDRAVDPPDPQHGGPPPQPTDPPAGRRGQRASRRRHNP